MLVASVDIGTNTVRCLVGEVVEGVLRPRDVYRHIVRIGTGLRAGKEIDQGSLGRLRVVLGTLGEKIARAGCERVLAVGTSALREAGTSPSLKVSLEEALGFSIVIITGAEEARLTSVGVQAGIGTIGQGLVVDIGGGSTELVRVSRGAMVWWSSLPEGVVHLTEELLRDDPPAPEQIQALAERVRKLLEREKADGGAMMAATAGTPTTLAAMDLGIDEYDPTLVNGHVLSRKTVETLSRKLLGMTKEERLRLRGMERGREDLIVAGTLMVLEVMDRWDYKELTVSDWGLLEGVALAAAKNGE